MQKITHKITPYLWMETQAEEAANYYVSLFPNSRVDNVARHPDGKAFVVNFTLDGREYIALNGGPYYQLNSAFSLYVSCNDQAEVDSLWNSLSAVPEAEQCGWLVDKYGLTWQICPSILHKLLEDENPAKAGAVTEAMMQMKKLDIAGLQAAYDNA
jgi:predicted 3-demethylubiquinone-9 3-methyltransferase (glyoxalase superfamily)